MQKGFSLPAILIVSTLLLLGVVLFLFPFKNVSNAPNVKGASVKSSENTAAKLSFKITSTLPNWLFFEYSCETLTDCSRSLESGTRLNIIGGGPASNYPISVMAPKKGFAKFYVKQGWGNDLTSFSANLTSDGKNIAQIVNLSKEGKNYDAIIISSDSLEKNLYEIGAFINN